MIVLRTSYKIILWFENTLYCFSDNNPQILANIIEFLFLTYIILEVEGGAYGYS